MDPEDGCPLRPYGLYLAVAVFKVIVALTTAILNLIVIIALYKVYMNRKPDYFPLRSMATADLVLGGLVQPTTIIIEYFSIKLETCLFVTDYLNRAREFVDITFWTGSVLSTCLLCWVRYTSITTPFVCRALLAKSYLKFVWALAIAVAIPALVLPSVNPKWEFGYRIVYSLVAFYIPVVVMTFWYVGIVRALMEPLDMPMQSFRGGPSLADMYHVVETQGDRIRSRQAPAKRNITFIMILFISTSMPYFLVIPLEFFGFCAPPLLREWLRWLRFLNCAVNPLIYAIGTPSVRKVLRTFIIRNRAADRPTSSSAFRHVSTIT